MIYPQLFSRAIADREKVGEDRNTKTWIFQKWKKPFRLNKEHFSWIFKGYLLVKTCKIADTSFHLPPTIFFSLLPIYDITNNYQWRMCTF